MSVFSQADKLNKGKIGNLGQRNIAGCSRNRCSSGNNNAYCVLLLSYMSLSNI